MPAKNSTFTTGDVLLTCATNCIGEPTQKAEYWVGLLRATLRTEGGVVITTHTEVEVTDVPKASVATAVRKLVPKAALVQVTA